MLETLTVAEALSRRVKPKDLPKLSQHFFFSSTDNPSKYQKLTHIRANPYAAPALLAPNPSSYRNPVPTTSE